jgi:hypothetical protein
LIARHAVTEFSGIELCKIFIVAISRQKCDACHGNRESIRDNTHYQSHIHAGFFFGYSAMKNIPEVTLPDGIVTVHLEGERYRGAYYFRGDNLVVTGYGLNESSTDLKILGGERGKAALNLAKLVLIDMVREVMDINLVSPGLSLQGSTTRCSF